MQMTPKQQGMLAYQLKASHDGSFEQCALDREAVEKVKKINEVAALDRQEASKVIEALVNHNRDQESPILQEAANKALHSIIQKYGN